MPVAAPRSPREGLATLIVLDQFSRNLFRDDRRAFGDNDESSGLVLCGHPHPVFALPGMTRRWLGFWHRPGMLVLPAFSAFTGVGAWTWRRASAACSAWGAGSCPSRA